MPTPQCPASSLSSGGAACRVVWSRRKRRLLVPHHTKRRSSHNITTHLHCRAAPVFTTLLIVVVVVLSLHAPVAAARKTRITWINGIGYNLEHMVEGQVTISKFFGGKPIVFCHNPTAMAHEEDIRGYLSDLTQAGQQKLLGLITDEVNALVRHLQEAVQAVGRRGRVLHIAHSQGALVTHLATKQLQRHEMERLEVLTFGGAVALQCTPETPFARCVNYYAINDPLLWVVPAAVSALRSGLSLGDDFCFLAPRGGDPVVDHALLGPTYSLALQWEGLRFAQLYVSPLHRVSRWLLLVVVAMVRGVVRQLLQQVVWRLLVRPILLFCAWAHTTTVHGAAWMHGLVIHRLLLPLLWWIRLVWEWFMINVRGQEKYEPVSTILPKQKERRS